MDNTSTRKQIINELMLILVGCILYSLSVVLFIDPIHIIPGSVTGIAVIVKALFNIPLGVLNIVINVPLVLIAVFFLGKKLLVYTCITILLNSLFMDAFAFLGAFTQDMMLASIFGGVIMGVGLGMILKAGATTGGTTVVGRLVVRKYPNIQIGNVLMVGDFIIITVGSILLKDWDLMLYSLINLYICSIINNKVIYGTEAKLQVSITSVHRTEIRNTITDNFGCKVVEGKDDRELFCYIAKSQLGKLQRQVEKIDPEAAVATIEFDYIHGDVTKLRTE